MPKRVSVGDSTKSSSAMVTETVWVAEFPPPKVSVDDTDV